MGRVYAIANQKGGVGKTTTSVNAAASLAVAEKKPLLVIDMDPQGNAGSGLGVSSRDVTRGTYDVLLGRARLEDVLCPTALPTLKVCPASPALVAAELELIDMEQRDMLLRHALERARRRYDYVFIDCPPSLGLLTLNALCAADAVLVPMQCEFYALEGLAQLVSTIERVKADAQPGAAHRGRAAHHVRPAQQPRAPGGRRGAQALPRVFDSVVPRNVRLSRVALVRQARAPLRRVLQGLPGLPQLRQGAHGPAPRRAPRAPEPAAPPSSPARAPDDWATQ
jgi:chromosome partitioning protein